MELVWSLVCQSDRLFHSMSWIAIVVLSGSGCGCGCELGPLDWRDGVFVVYIGSAASLYMVINFSSYDFRSSD